MPTFVSRIHVAAKTARQNRVISALNTTVRVVPLVTLASTSREPNASQTNAYVTMGSLRRVRHARMTEGTSAIVAAQDSTSRSGRTVSHVTQMNALARMV